MAIVTAYDQLGRGVYIRAGDFFSVGSNLTYDDNAVVEQFDYDTLLIAATYNGGTYGVGFLLDDIGSDYVYQIDFAMITNSQLDTLVMIENLNLQFDIRDDFSDGVFISNLYAGADRFYGNRYADYIEAGAGNDFVSGGSGNDTLLGGAGADTLLGGAHNDYLRGGSGNDRLQGGLGKDRLQGEANADVFLFATVAESGGAATTADVISDFVRGSDKISLSAIDAFAGTSTNNVFVWRGTAAFGSTTAGEVRFQKYDNAGTTNDYTMVYLDNDADSTAEGAIRLTGLHNLTATDFLL